MLRLAARRRFAAFATLLLRMVEQWLSSKAGLGFRGRPGIQQFKACGWHCFYPRPFCRYCASGDVDWVEVSGRAGLTSYVITQHRLRGFDPVSPIIAIVELDEGPG
jgi:hypothetical protein